jgi:GT2 family glycosyltransferase/nucleoside-diphosphate-sugar epimerase
MGERMRSCGVVIVSYHTGPGLFVVAGSVLQQEGLSELVIVDNGNPPDVLSKFQQMALSEPRLRIVSGHGNIGYARGCNLGAKYVSGDYLLMLSPRCLLPPNALSELVAACESMPDAIIAGGELLNPDGSRMRLCYAQGLTAKTMLAETFGLARWLVRNRAENAVGPYEVEAVSSAAICLRKKDYASLVGFDEGYFLDVADSDLCMRVRTIGGRILSVPSVAVVQLPKEGRRRISRGREWQRVKGLLRYFTKHFQRRYFPGFLLLINAAILLRFAMAMVVTTLRVWLAPRIKLNRDTPTKRLMVLASVLAQLPQGRELYGRTVLVTGGTGQVGLSVIRRLIASGAAVLAMSRGGVQVPFAHEHLRWIKGDLTDQKLHLHGYLIDMAVHCAPLEHLPPTIDLLADAEVKRVIAFSSTSIFGKALSKNAHEKDVVEKLVVAENEIAERCNARGIQWTILRPTMIYGVGLDLGVTSLAKIIDRFASFPIYPPAFGRRQPVHADDLAIAVLQAAFSAETIGKAYNLSGGDVMTYRQMLERIYATLGRKPVIRPTTLLPFMLDVAGKISRKKHINGEIARRMNDDLMFFHDDARRDFGFNPRGFLSGGLKDLEGY